MYGFIPTRRSPAGGRGGNQAVLPDGRLQWLGRPGNWVLREGGSATNCCYHHDHWQPPATDS